MLRCVEVSECFDGNVESLGDAERRREALELHAPTHAGNPGAITLDGIGKFLVGETERGHCFRDSLELLRVSLANHAQSIGEQYSPCQAEK